MALTVLNVAYPLAPVSRDSVGGGEQVVSLLDHALVCANHRSIVIAMQGSATAGELIPLPHWSSPLESNIQEAATAAARHAIQCALSRYKIDVIHLHGIDFLSYLPDSDIPVIATLHLPPAWYGPQLFQHRRPKTVYCCVSESQRIACSAAHADIRVIPNGVRVEDFWFRARKKCYALLLARICPEKGVHLALEAAHRAGCRLWIAGQVYGYPTHRSYFDQEVVPLLDRKRQFIGPATFERKRRLLAGARCLLVPSLAEETSSLVVMEAMASGTPVISYPNGALPELVRHGETGFLVSSVEQMADAIRNVDAIQPSQCREYALRHFSAAQCTSQYLALYRE